MFDFFKPIIDFFNFIVSSILQLVSLVRTGYSIMVFLFGMLPSVVTITAMSLVAVCVIYKILGRENQS